MKKLFAILMMAGLFGACDIETSGNGDLDGFWVLLQADTLATGGVADMRSVGATWAFQGSILEIRTQDDSKNMFCKFAHEGGKLQVKDAHWVDRDHEDPVVESLDELRLFGINRYDETFDVISLNSDDMVLQSQVLRLHLRKY